MEQVCALFGNLNTETHFTKLHEKREDGLYQSLFLNRRLINPLDPAFQSPTWTCLSDGRNNHRATSRLCWRRWASAKPTLTSSRD